MWGILVNVFFGILGLFGYKKNAPSAEAKASANAATAEDQLSQLEKENAALKVAADARNAADAQRVRDDPNADKVDADPKSAINLDPDLDLRP